MLDPDKGSQENKTESRVLGEGSSFGQKVGRKERKKEEGENTNTHTPK